MRYVVSRYLVAVAAAAAAGIIAAIVLYGDIPYRMQDGKEITVIGPMICLPHKQGLFSGPQTEECAFGFRGQDGRHFALSNYGEIEENNPGLLVMNGRDATFNITGTFQYGGSAGYENYDVTGMVDADSVSVRYRDS
jgi:hypothetical protein